MPIYMDVHIVPGVKARDVAEAHRQDILKQEEHGCKCMTYWIDEQRESIFCLIEAPAKEAVEEMHRRAHGLVPNRIIEVNSAVVEAFLGRIYDPREAKISDDGLKVFTDPSFRILFVSQTIDPALLRYKLGTDEADELLHRHNQVVRQKLEQHNGREVEYQGSGFIASFVAAGPAVICALDIQKEIQDAGLHSVGLRIAVNAGEPVEKSNKLFGDTIQLATHICTIARDFQVAITSTVRELASKDPYLRGKNNLLMLSPQDESLLELLFRALEENWQDADFDMENYCQAVAMSKSQLYRKTISLTGLSPNLLLKEFRLAKAKELMKKQQYSIAQITFDSGFTSASYFTKCFKKTFGLLPMAYLDLLQ